MLAPFPWFGGKSKVSDLVWQRFGDVPTAWMKRAMEKYRTYLEGGRGLIPSSK